LEDFVKNIRIEDYNYPLDEDRIAKYPVEPRDSSKLLIYRQNEIREDRYRNLTEYLPARSRLVFNQTKVIQARLLFPKNEQTTIEIFCLEPVNMDIQQAMQCRGEIVYRCMVGGARKWKNYPLSITTSAGTEVTAHKIENKGGSFLIRFTWNNDLHFAQVLEEGGRTPLPPYLNRKAEESDKDAYQTLFAVNEGSVAAPTAGLHFTDSLLSKLTEEGFAKSFLTLHVGAGTFKAVNTPTLKDHEMHAEEFWVDSDFIQEILAGSSRPIIPVGTTSMRSLESIYWLGVKALKGQLNINEATVSQWEPYQQHALPGPTEALEALKQKMSEAGITKLTAHTSLIIAPGYEHQICAGLLTNFHQPQSTLLLLVASMIGEEWKSVYNYALSHNFRFLSYGDGCLILR